MTMFRRRSRAHPRPRPLHRRLDRRRSGRPDRRRAAHRVRLLALGAVRQRADRPGRGGASLCGCCPRPSGGPASSTSAGRSPRRSGWRRWSTGSCTRPPTAGAGSRRCWRSPSASGCSRPSSASSCRASHPITPLRLFADRSRAASYLARLLLVAGMMGMFFFLTQFLQDVLGYSPAQDRAGLPAADRDGVQLLAVQCARPDDALQHSAARGLGYQRLDHRRCCGSRRCPPTAATWRCSGRWSCSGSATARRSCR